MKSSRWPRAVPDTGEGPPPARRARMVQAALAVTLGLAVAGCYTMLKHPAGDPTAESECSRCHEESGQIAETWKPWVEPYLWSTSPWINYYGAPWWQEWRWHRGTDEIGSSTEPARPPGRAAWGRVPLAGTTDQDLEATRRRQDGASPPPVPGPTATPATPTAPAGEVTPAPAAEKPAKPEEKAKELPPSQRTLRR